MEVNKFISKQRFIFILVCILIFLILLVRQFAKYMIFQEQQVKVPKIIAERGTIFDRNKRILAVQTTLYNLACNKSLIKNYIESSKILAPVLEMTEESINAKIQNSNSNFLYIKKRMSESEKDLVLTEIERHELKGFSIEAIFNRTYPENKLASTVVGFLGDDGTGLTGVEYTLQNILSPPPDIKGYNGKGYDVELSIDGNIQYMMEKISSNVMQETKADGMIFLAADARTGGILAYISEPAPSLSNFTASTAEQRFDRPANFIYEPGSVFKIFSMAAFLELGTAVDGDTYICDGHFSFLGRHKSAKLADPITCLRVHGNVTPRDIIRVSCNDGISQIADKTDNNAFYNKLKEFGFGSKTGIELPGTTSGLFSPPKYWSVRSKHTIAMGQEIGVSALQIVEAATAIANGGTVLKLTLISKILDKDGNIVYLHHPIPLKKVISEKNSKLILSYMQTASAEGGTGWRASINGVPIAVKTGTAQMANKDRAGYSRTDFLSSCIGIFPADDPQVILYAAIIKPVGKTYGELIAAPAISKAANDIIDYLGLARENAPIIEHSGRIPIHQKRKIIFEDEMPNLIGVSKKELIDVIMSGKYNFVIKGEGYIFSQSPEEGYPLIEGMTIELNLK